MSQIVTPFPGISLLALSAVQGYHGYVLFAWLYGICLGGFTYSLKMFTLERIRSRHFTKAWGFVQGAKSVPVLIGIPITGYINQTYPKAGYYFSFVSTVVGASLMFMVGTKKESVPTPLPANEPCAVSACKLSCVCPYNGLYAQVLTKQQERVYNNDTLPAGNSSVRFLQTRQQSLRAHLLRLRQASLVPPQNRTAASIPSEESELRGQHRLRVVPAQVPPPESGSGAVWIVAHEGQPETEQERSRGSGEVGVLRVIPEAHR